MEGLDSNTYQKLFTEIITAIDSARYRAYKSVNNHQISLNFEIGRLIVKSQSGHKWGKSVVESLSKDLNKILDGQSGYSPQNLWYMRQFYLEYNEKTELLRLALDVPWSHNLMIMTKGEE